MSLSWPERKRNKLDVENYFIITKLVKYFDYPRLFWLFLAELQFMMTIKSISDFFSIRFFNTADSEALKKKKASVTKNVFPFKVKR